MALELFSLKQMGQFRPLSDEELISRLATGQYNNIHLADPFKREALAFGPSESLEGAKHARIYEGGVGVLDLAGPIYRHAGDAPSGAISTSRVARDLMLLRKSDKVRSILVVQDTPGGEATGGDELAQKFFETAQEKHIETYIEGLGASLGYYFAAPTKKITGSRNSLAGSIGVVMGVPLPKGTLTIKGEGADGEVTEDEMLIHEDSHGLQYVEFVSSVSPLKRLNPLTKKGMLHCKNIVDKCAGVFVSDVVRFRGSNQGLTKDTLPTKYGDGGVYPAEDAVEMGMIDDIDSFEHVHDRLARSFYSAKGGGHTTGVDPQQQEQEEQKEDVDGSITIRVKGEQTVVVNTNDITNPLIEGNGGKPEMGLKILDKLRGNSGGQPQKPPSTTQPQEGQLPVKEVLETLITRRPALEQQFESKAILAATRLVTDNKIPSNMQSRAAYKFTTAYVDDALYGGTVLFVGLSKEGEDVEMEGTRVAQLEAEYEAISRESLTTSRVRSVREGTAESPVALTPSRAAQGKTFVDPNEPGGSEDYTDEELLNQTSQGRAALANRQQSQNGSNRVN